MQKLTGKGTYDDETRPPRRHWGQLGREKKRKEPRPLPPADLPQVPGRVVKAPRLSEFESEEELIPDPESRPPKRERGQDEDDMEADAELDIDRLLHDVEYLPPGQPLSSTPNTSRNFREQRAQNEFQERPWHVRQASSGARDTSMMVQDFHLGEDTLLSVTIDIPHDAQA